MSGVAIGAIACWLLFIAGMALALVVELHRERARRNPKPVEAVDVPAEWARLEQRAYLARIFTPRLFVLLALAGGVIGAPWLALVIVDSERFLQLWLDDMAWLDVPQWWLLSLVGSFVLPSILAIIVMRGHLCPECRRRLDTWTSPRVALRGGGSGCRVLLMCPACRIVFQAPWHVWVTGTRSGG